MGFGVRIPQARQTNGCETHDSLEHSLATVYVTLIQAGGADSKVCVAKHHVLPIP